LGSLSSMPPIERRESREVKLPVRPSLARMKETAAEQNLTISLRIIISYVCGAKNVDEV